MMKKNIIFFSLFLSISIFCFGQNCTPSRDVEITDDGIIVTYHFHGGLHQEDPLHPGAKFWKIPGFGMNNVSSEPAFPFHWDTFAIPDNVEVNVEVIDSAYTDTLFTLAPAYPPLLMSDTIGYTPERVPPIASYNGWFPNCAVKKGNIQYYRGQGLINVVTLPVQYDYYTQTVRNFSFLQYKVSFTHNGTKVRGRNYASATSDSKISLSDHFLENITLNYSQSCNSRKNIATKTNRSSNNDAVLDNRDYLIITTPTFSDAAYKLAEWKRIKGFRTHVEIKTSWSVTTVKNIIMELYNSDGCNLYYVLFIGRNNVVPGYTKSGEFFPMRSTDYYFGCPEDTLYNNVAQDFIPSIRRGRLLAGNSSEAMIIVNKIINYESNPSQDSDFYQKGIHCAYFQDDSTSHYNIELHKIEKLPPDGCEDTRMTLTSEDIKNYLEAKGKQIERIYLAQNRTNPYRWNNGGYASGDSIPVELQRPNYSWNGNASDIITGINNKAFYVLYNGHGTNTNWLDPIFSATHINQLTNSHYLPVVFSMACQTGNYRVANSFAEMFLKKNNGGCVAIFAASQVSHMGYNDTFVEGFINSIWPEPGLYFFFRTDSLSSITLPSEPVYELGDIMDNGGLYLRHLLSPSSDSIDIQLNLYNRDINHIFGDPSMMIYTDTPISFSNPVINVHGDSISVTTDIENARISLYIPSEDTQNVDSYVGNHVDYYTTADSIIICIDQHNYIPYIVKICKSSFIQNENINDQRIYTNFSNIKVGRNVTTTKPEGDVTIDGAHFVIKGGNVELHPGTTIINSKVIMNAKE